MPDHVFNDLRGAMLARMGITRWQLRRPEASDQAPTGRLWIRAERLPAAPLLGDLCAALGLNPDEVSLLPAGPLPAGQPEWLLLTEADAAAPHALICPLEPDADHKRALWHQIRSRHA